MKIIIITKNNMDSRIINTVLQSHTDVFFSTRFGQTFQSIVVGNLVPRGVVLIACTNMYDTRNPIVAIVKFQGGMGIVQGGPDEL